jgi:hypothetical protein
VFAFLCVEVTKKENGEISLKQQGLNEKILRSCGMEGCNTKATLCGSVPLGTDELGPHCKAEWEYASVPSECSSTYVPIQGRTYSSLSTSAHISLIVRVAVTSCLSSKFASTYKERAISNPTSKR